MLPAAERASGFGWATAVFILPNMTRPTLLLVLLAATFLIDGVAGAFVPPQAERSAAVIHGVAIAIICYAWARADATTRGMLAPGRSALYAALLPVLGVPAYLFRTRGAAKGALGSAKAFAFFVALVLLDASVRDGIAVLRG
jgi:hypothetical protein